MKLMQLFYFLPILFKFWKLSRFRKRRVIISSPCIVVYYYMFLSTAITVCSNSFAGQTTFYVLTLAIVVLASGESSWLVAVKYKLILYSW